MGGGGVSHTVTRLAPRLWCALQVLVAYHAAQKGATGLVQVGRKLSENLAASSGSFGKGKKAPSFQVSKVRAAIEPAPSNPKPQP